MDTIKVIWGIYPIILEVIDHELKVWRNPGRLNRTQIITDNTCPRIFAGHQSVSMDYFLTRDSLTDSAMSIAQMPVPVPKSRIASGCSRGAR
jgi:hypothetical protein